MFRDIVFQVTVHVVENQGQGFLVDDYFVESEDVLVVELFHETYFAHRTGWCAFGLGEGDFFQGDELVGCLVEAFVDLSIG